MLIFNDLSTGAKADIQMATDLARSMVCEWGMSEKLGPLSYGKKGDQVFLGKELSQSRDYSDSIALEIDNEVHDMVSSGYKKAYEILGENKDKLELLANALLEHETLDLNDIESLMDNGTIPPRKKSSPEEIPSDKDTSSPLNNRKPSSPTDLAPGQA